METTVSRDDPAGNPTGAPKGTPGRADLARYHRQMLLPGIGEEGQRRLLSGHALIVGCGALGTPIADLLARAGVGRLTLIDRDTVEPTNLQRQTLYDEADAASSAPKADAAARRLARINSATTILPIIADFNPRTAEKLAIADGPRPGVILDGTDNFQTRYLINDLCTKHGIPYVYGGAVGTVGMSMTILPRGSSLASQTAPTPCLRCVFPDIPAPGTTPTCDTAGVLAPVTAMVGAHQAAEAIKLLLGRPDLISRDLVQFDLWANHRRRLDIGPPREDCPCCGQRDFAFLSGSLAARASILCGRDSVQINPAPDTLRGRLDLPALADRLSAHGTFEATRLLVRGVLRDEGLELTVFPDARAIIKGTTEPDAAMTIYARYIGV